MVRRLLVEGYGASVINTLARSQTNSDLEALLQGGVQLTFAPANPALAFLQQIHQRQPDVARSVPKSPPPPELSSPASPDHSPSSQWVRLEILSGLELHVRSDFVLPTTSQEQQNLLQHMLDILRSITPLNRKSPKL